MLPPSQKISLFSKRLEALVRSFAMFIFRIDVPQAETPLLPSVSPWEDSREQGEGEREDTGLSRGALTAQREVPGAGAGLPRCLRGDTPPCGAPPRRRWETLLLLPHPSPAVSIPAWLDPAPVPRTTCRPRSMFSHGGGSSPRAHTAELVQLWAASPPLSSSSQIFLFFFPPLGLSPCLSMLLPGLPRA